MSLPKSLRLPLRFEKDRVNKEGMSSSGRFFTLVTAQGTGSSSRFAIIISKKISPLATDRNRLRRVVSAILHQTLSSITPNDYLIIPKYSSLSQTSAVLKKDLLSLFHVKSTP